MLETASRSYTRSRVSKLSVARYVLFWLVVSVGGVFYLGHRSDRDALLAEREKVVVGTIAELHLGKCVPADYTFQFEDKVFRGTGCGKDLGVYVGSRVNVYFDPQNPTINGLHSFKLGSTSAKDLKTFMVYLSIGLAAVSALLWLNVWNS